MRPHGFAALFCRFCFFMAASKGFRILSTTNPHSFIATSYLQSSKKSASADVDEGPALLKYNGKDARFKDEKDLKVGLLEISPWT